jgi:phosphoglycolate phosphatase/putative hydrolase of the HAD superfamily
MRIYRIPETISAFIFDLDSTLYTNDAYVRWQMESPVRRLAGLRGVDFERMQADIRDYRNFWAASHDGAQTSLGNVFVFFGVSLEETARWREELYDPAVFLRADEDLKRALALLAETGALGLYTNTPVSVARKTLAVLGVAEFFPVIVGLDTFNLSKPHRTPLLKAAELLAAPAAECVAVGDRFDIDLALPLALGMGGILVSGVRDVYRLPEMLGAKA